MNKKYYDCLLYQIKKNKMYYYSFYCISIIITYLFIIISAVNLTNFAYNNFLFNNSSANILCFSCDNYKSIILKFLLYIMLLNIVFYTINEIRFRIIRFKKIRKINLELGNFITSLTAILLFCLLVLLTI